MNAIILCAGLSKRLRPFSMNNPKCLINYGNTNLLNYWINNLNKMGINKILINTHYCANKINEFIKKHPLKYKIKITFEKKLLGTAGTLIKNIDFFNNSDGLLLHGDNYTEQNLEFFILKHKQRPKSCDMSMLTFNSIYPQNCGIVKFNEKKILTKFYEKPKIYKGSIANSAIYVLSKKMLKDLKKNLPNAKDFSNEVIPKYLNKIYCIHTNNYLSDIGNFKNLFYLRNKKRFYANKII